MKPFNIVERFALFKFVSSASLLQNYGLSYNFLQFQLSRSAVLGRLVLLTMIMGLLGNFLERFPAIANGEMVVLLARGRIWRLRG
jgi:hypothetical protein